MERSNVFGGFHAVELNFSQNYAPATIYVKEHFSHAYDENKPLGKTVFIVNIPPYLNETNLLRIFSKIGKISHIILQRGIPTKNKTEINWNGFQSCYLVFGERESVHDIINSQNISSNCDLLSGLNKYAIEYNELRSDPENLLREGTETVNLYDEKIEQEKLKEEDNVDDDGWTLVTKKGRNLGSILRESLKDEMKKKSKKTLKNFYAFQIRESKKQQLTILREQHEEAKRKIAEMKKLRTFKPY